MLASNTFLILMNFLKTKPFINIFKSPLFLAQESNKKIIILLCLAAVLITLGMPGPSIAETYQYDTTGRLTKVIYDDGSSIEYQYDNAGNIISTNICVPTGQEVCGDHVDNNCDGRTDEGCCPAEGDVNQDNSVTAADALMAFQYYLGLTNINQCQQDQADVNNDNSITPSDALCIFQEYLGLESCLTAP